MGELTGRSGPVCRQWDLASLVDDVLLTLGAWVLTTVAAGNDVGQCCCRAVKDLRTWHAVNRTINLPSHRTISALLEGLGRFPFWTVGDLAGASGRAVVYWTTGTRGWWGCHIRFPLGFWWGCHIRFCPGWGCHINSQGVSSVPRYLNRNGLALKGMRCACPLA